MNTSRRRRRLRAEAPVRSREGRTVRAIGRRVPKRLRRGEDEALAGRRAIFAIAGGLPGLTARGGAHAAITALTLTVLGWRAGGLAHARAERERAEAVGDALPDAIDLLAICVLAGMGLDPALRLVAEESSGPFGAALRSAVAALDVGLPREAAYQTLADAAGTAEVRAFVAALRRAERYGAPLADVLANQAADARERRRAHVRERAMSAPVRMLFPLTLCFLPAFVLLAIAPSLIVAVRSFKGW